MKNILVIGSIAYDHIMEFNGVFKDSIIPEELEHLSVSFLAKSHEVNFGGCSCNIAYTLKLLGEKPHIVGVCGNDFDTYQKWLKKNRISLDCIQKDDKNPTAAAYILDDKRQNQITIFSPGAMANQKLCYDFSDCDLSKIDLAVVAPDVPARMLALSENLIKKGIKYVFDPGQAISALSKEYLALIIDGSIGVIANEYEGNLLEEKLCMKPLHFAKWAGFYIKTYGEDGCVYYDNRKHRRIPAVKGLQVIDVTGCGDAFRSGFLHGYASEKSLEDCCKYGNAAASFVIDKMGTQTHSFTYKDFLNRLKKFYGV